MRQSQPTTESYVLNGTKLTFLTENGVLLSMCNDCFGEMIRKGTGIIDIALPVELEYENLRVSADGRYGGGSRPEFAFDGKTLRISWRKLAKNTEMEEIDAIKGGVSAEVIFRACDDDVSIAMRCVVTNHAQADVRQILFPDFQGLLPIAGHEDTKFTTLGVTDAPFVSMADIPERRGFFAEYLPVCGRFYRPGGYFSSPSMIGRWFDYGGLDGGFSLYRKWWGWGPEDMNKMGAQELYWLRYDNAADYLRIAAVHYPTLKTGESFESGEYIFTPHEGGWAEGIRPYEQWVEAHKKRVVPLPAQIRDGLGFRTAWISEVYPKDPELISRYYREFPDMARDMVEHGLYELNTWGCVMNESIPYNEENFQAFFAPELGGAQGWKNAVEECRKLGVNVSPLVSWISTKKKNADRYGLEKCISSAEGGWTETRKAIPCFRAPYMNRYKCAVINSDNEQWLKDVERALAKIRDDASTPSICWDQVIISSNMKLSKLIREYRRKTYEKYPDAVFSGESTFQFEDDIDYLDYTWDWENWPGTGDARPYIRAVKTTRPNINVDASPLYAKYCFMDNVFMNVFPSKVGGCSGSAMIADYPEFSRVLKCLAALRKAYLSYFTEGEMLGECVLYKYCRNARVTGYRLRNSALIIVTKTDKKLSYLAYNLERYLGPGEKRVVIKDLNGGLVSDQVRYAKDELVIGGSSEELFMIEVTNIE